MTYLSPVKGNSNFTTVTMTDDRLPLKAQIIRLKDWSLRSLQVKLIKMGGRIVRHARQIVFQLAEVAVSRELFAAILERVSRLRLTPG